MRLIMFYWCISKVLNLHLRGKGSSPVRGRFTIEFLCRVVDPKEKRWYKYVFDHCVD